MKKLLIIIFVIYISFPTYYYANANPNNGVCLIKDSTAPVLLEYLKDNKKVIKNITKEIIKKGNVEYKGINRTLSKIYNSGNETVSIFNEIFSFNGYKSYFEYFAVFPILNEVPYEVKRDYRILQNENEGLINYLYKLDKKGNMNLIIANACDGVAGKCNLNGLKSKKILKKLIQNNSYILDLYRLSIMGEINNFSYQRNLILIKNDFILEIEKYYGMKSLNICNNSKDSFGERVNKSMKNIEFINKSGEKAKEKWKYAWKLLIGEISKNDTAKIEKRLLLNHLAEQGVSTSSKEIILNNLEKYDSEGGFSLNNNFITNTIKNIKNKISSTTSNFLNENVFSFFNKKDNTVEVNINDISKIDSSSQTTKQIQDSISKLYENELPFTAISDISTENLRAKIIKTHISLNESVEILDKTIKISKSICNSQGGGGNCN